MKKLPIITKKTKEILVVTPTIPGKKTQIEYFLDGEKISVLDDEQALAAALRRTYRNQGEYYLDVYGVPQETAAIAEWHPSDADFQKNCCSGWRKFLLDKGIANVHVNQTEETISSKLF